MADKDNAQIAGLICVGAIAGAFGVAGEARLKSFCADPRAIAGYGPLVTEDGARKFTVKLIRAVKEGFAARLSGVTTREEAEALKGTRLYALRLRLPSLPDDEFYHADLVGLTVLDTGGVEIGKVCAIHDYGAGDMLEVVCTDAKLLGRTVLIPFTQAAVPTVDLAQGRIVADPPIGILGGNDDDDAEEPEA
jgi:16S rRNA processing protein RimM